MHGTYHVRSLFAGLAPGDTAFCCFETSSLAWFGVGRRGIPEPFDVAGSTPPLIGPVSAEGIVESDVRLCIKGKCMSIIVTANLSNDL